MRLSILSLPLMLGLVFGACSDDDDNPPAKDKGVADATTGPEPDVSMTSKVEDYVPADGAVAGWTRDGELQSAYTSTEMFALINGSHEDYDAEGCVGLALQSYVNGDLIIDLRIWEMEEAAGAKAMYDKNIANPDLTFSSIDVAEGASIAEQTPQWIAYGYKGAYIYKVAGTFTTTENKPTLEADMKSFVQHLAGLLP